MSFQAYLDNIQKQTGLSPTEFMTKAEEKGFLQNGQLTATVKATEITNWLKADFDLGHGHAMAMYAYFKGKRDWFLVLVYNWVSFLSNTRFKASLIIIFIKN